MIEAWGRGIERIKETCQQENYPAPEWKLEPSGLWVIFHLETNTEGEQVSNGERLRSIMNDCERLDANEIMIIEYLIENEKITRKQVIEVLNVQQTKAYYVLDGLLEKGILTRKGQGRGTYYEIKEDD